MDKEIKECFLKALAQDDLETLKELIKKNPKFLKVLFAFENKEKEEEKEWMAPLLNNSLYPTILPIQKEESEKQITLLMAAVYYGAKKVVQYLLTKKLSLEPEDGFSALEVAVLTNQKEMVDLLFKKSTFGAVKKSMFRALENKNFEMASFLEQKNKQLSFSFWGLFYNIWYENFSFPTFLKRRFKKEGLKVKDVLKASERTLVAKAIQKGDIELLKWLKSQQIDILNADRKKHMIDMEPLSLAVLLRQEKVAHFLIQEGANVNKLNHLGLSPLHLAAQFNLTEIASLLLENGAYVDMPADMQQKEPYRQKVNGTLPGETPLMRASLNGAKEMVALLLEKEANIDLQDATGQTALMKVASKGQEEMTLFLIQQGADVRLRDASCHNAFILAKINRHCQIEKIILNAIDRQKKRADEKEQKMLVSKQGLSFNQSGEHIKE